MADFSLLSPAERRRACAAWYLLAGHRTLWNIPLFAAIAIFIALLMLRGMWIFYGAVKGLIQAEVLAVTSPFKRALFILSGVFTIASPVLLLCGGTLWLARVDSRLISPGMSAWSVPLVITGCIGLALRVRLGLLTRRAARAALANPAEPL
jgi:hypothetical protein